MKIDEEGVSILFKRMATEELMQRPKWKPKDIKWKAMENCSKRNAIKE